MEEGQKLAVRLVGRNGRRRFDQSSKDRLIAACLEPGASVSKLAREHGVNANLVWKWMRKHTQPLASPPSSTSSFIPVQITAASDEFEFSEEMPRKAERNRPLPSPAKVSASLPNGVKLTLECGDVDALTAIIGALGHVQTGADLKVYLQREPIDFRAGINSLAVLVQETMALDPFAPAVFAFCNRRRDRVNLLFLDRSGFFGAADRRLRMANSD
ncbi:transposase (plasmid) [Rhizobium leguminosarum bv. trifolii CB782]|nr:transposase [Rhizobium leguminosarum bv. trifolii CB782]